MKNMDTDKEYCLGVMSGTSLDGLDIALLKYSPQPGEHPTIMHGKTYPLNQELKEQCLHLFEHDEHEIDRMHIADQKLGTLIGETVNQFLEENQLDKKKILAIGSHGQTIRHVPQKHFSVQIGNPFIISEITNIPTVANFRQRDLAANGQGAPLAPHFHETLFRTEKENRIIVNIGGIANLSILPADSSKHITGYDVGPGNALLDSWISKHKPNITFDQSGKWASQGTSIPELLEVLLDEPFFHYPSPKSTGKDLFNISWIEDKLTKIDKEYSTENVQATLTELTAYTIAEAIVKENLDTPHVILCGGGRLNTAILKSIEKALSQTFKLSSFKLASSDELGVNGDWIEAAAFAWFASETIQGKKIDLSNVTGSKGSRILGAIYPA